ncbi:unnamed protein product [Schistosoma turkestanicum]|nr:unnamed protein product [Schistosoma turkestanicum]
MMKYSCILNLFIPYFIFISYTVENLQKSNLFCTNSMLETGFTDIILNSSLPLFGKQKWFSIETLTNMYKLYKLRLIHYHKCFKKPIRKFDACWNSIRQKFIDSLIPTEHIDRVIITKFEQKKRKATVTDATYLKFLHALCLTACLVRYRENLGPIKNGRILCPYPCVMQKDCSFSECKNYGLFKHEYECPCNGSNKWDRESNECLPKKIYKIRQTRNYPDMIMREKILRQRKPRNCEYNSKCNKNGTLFCSLDSNYGHTICVCKLDYHGRYCQDKINACLFRIEHHLQPNGGTKIAGNTACNINNSSNKCVSLISAEGDASYQCQCDETHWMPDIRLPYPNCMHKFTKCDSIVCVNGFCVTNDHNDQAKCVCNPGYSGLACEEWVGEWSEWSKWDQCRPACGSIRYSLRQRDCLSMKLGNKSKSCLGSSIEYLKCSEHLYKGIPYSDVYYAIQQNAIVISFTFGGVLCVTIVIFWILLFSVFIKSSYGLLKKLYLQKRKIEVKKPQHMTLEQDEREMSAKRYGNMDDTSDDKEETNN